MGHRKLSLHILSHLPLLSYTLGLKTLKSLLIFFCNQTIQGLPILSKFEDMSPEKWGKEVDVIFCCLPHATTQLVIASLPPAVKVVDLSADFRLADVKVYEKWYGGEHKAPELQKEAVYAIPEFSRDQIKRARLVANPGCYPTAAQLPLVPLLKAGLVLSEDIIIDAKSGTTGAGRSPKQV